MAPPMMGPRWLEEEEEEEGGLGRGVGEDVCVSMFVVVLRSPLPADVTTETMEMTLTRLVGDLVAAPPPAFLVVDVDVDDDAGAGVGVVEVDEDEDEVDEVDVVSLDVVGPLPGFPMMLAEATAGPVVLIEATEVPLGSGKKSLELLLSQQTLDALRL